MTNKQKLQQIRDEQDILIDILVKYEKGSLGRKLTLDLINKNEAKIKMLTPIVAREERQLFSCKSWQK